MIREGFITKVAFEQRYEVVLMVKESMCQCRRHRLLFFLLAYSCLIMF